MNQRRKCFDFLSFGCNRNNKEDIKMNRRKNVPHPGDILSSEFLKKFNVTQLRLSQNLGCSHSKISEILSGKRGISAKTALGLADSFGNEPQYWLSLQSDFDIWEARKTYKKVPRLKKPKIN